MAKKQAAETPEPDPTGDVGAVEPDVDENGFAVGPKEQGPPELVLPDVVGAVTMPADLPNRIDSGGFDPVIVDGKIFHREDVEAGLSESVE